jgi:hypothetical protein
MAWTYTNVPAPGGVVDDNYNKFAINTSDAGAEIVISASKSNMTDADLLAVIRQLSQAGGSGNGSDTDGPDAFTVAGFGTADGTAFESGVTDVVYFRIQGSGGTPNLTTVSSVTLAAVAYFKPAK